jgi:hypothetical protein
MRGFVIYIIAVVLGVWLTPYVAGILHMSGLAEVGVLLVIVWVLAWALGLIPFPGPARNP